MKNTAPVARDAADDLRRYWPWARQLLADALRSGSVASLLSTLVVSWFSRQRTGHAAAGTNSASQWIWYPQARARFAASWRNTATGYVIHHASSVFWAGGYQLLRPERASRAGQVLRAGAIAAAAYWVDYHVVPRRLSPGFEHKIGAAGMWATYAGFGLGLVLGSRRRPQAGSVVAARRPRRAGMQPRVQDKSTQRTARERHPQAGRSS